MEKSKKRITDPYFDRLNLFLSASHAETERGKALVAASLIKEMLEEILCSFLLPIKQAKDLFKSPNGPLSNFSAKALLCRSLGLISEKEFRDIDVVRKIRNHFAHSVLCSIKNPKIISLANSLLIGMSIVDALPVGDSGRGSDPSQRFSMVTTSLVTSLYNRSYYVKRSALNDSVFAN